MNNHKWVFYIWEKHRFNSKVFIPACLIHIDYHWDAIFDFTTEALKKKLKELKDLDEIFAFVNDDYIKHDSFIVPAIFRSTINEVYFYCKQKYTNIGIHQPILDELGVKQHILDTAFESTSELVKLSTEVLHKIVFLDIDLDIFNRSEFYGAGNLWSDEEILAFIDDISELLVKSNLITIALSYGYSGDKGQTDKLAKLVIPEITKILHANENSYEKNYTTHCQR